MGSVRRLLQKSSNCKKCSKILSASEISLSLAAGRSRDLPPGWW
jgi:hypothetical protein